MEVSSEPVVGFGGYFIGPFRAAIPFKSLVSFDKDLELVSESILIDGYFYTSAFCFFTKMASASITNAKLKIPILRIF